MEFNTGICKVSYLGKNNPHALQNMGPAKVESSFAENYLEVQVNTNLANLVPHVSKKAKDILGSIKRHVASRSRK